MKENIKKYTGIIILIVVVIIILIIYQVFGAKTQVSPTPSPTPNPQTQQSSQSQSMYKLPSYSEPTLNASGQVDERTPSVQIAITQKALLKVYLPIYIENFQTSGGIATTLNVYTIPEDPDYLIHVEIYGIRYDDPNILEANNKNAQAFVDSFNKIKSLLLKDGVDIHNIYFVFGDASYVQNSADNLVNKYSLL